MTLSSAPLVSGLEEFHCIYVHYPLTLVSTSVHDSLSDPLSPGLPEWSISEEEEAEEEREEEME